MARTKNRPGAAPSAAHAAHGPAQPPGTAPAPGSPAAAVHAALAASPAATVAVIAGAAGTGKPAARDVLLAMEKAGTATRARGGKPGIPDTWTLASPARDDARPAQASPEHEHAGQPADGTASTLDGPGDNETASEASPYGTASPGQQDAGADASTGAAAGEGTSAAFGPATHNGPHSDNGAGDQDAASGTHDDEATPDSGDPQDPGDGDGPREEPATEDSGDQAADALDPVLVPEIAGRIAQIKAAADAAGIVLAGNLSAALAGLDEIAEQAAQARRSLKAAIGGRKTTAARPGGLRDKVLAHLDAHPGSEFTPHEIHKVLSHSSGAIANALDTLVKLGDAELATEKPRRFRRATNPAKAGASRADTADTAQDDGTELAGAA